MKNFGRFLKALFSLLVFRLNPFKGRPIRVKIDNNYLEQHSFNEIIDPIWWTVNIYDGEQSYKESSSQFSQEQRELSAVSWYLAEVSNGGHDQFFANSTGIVWKDALSCLRKAGISSIADILEESANRMGGSPSLDRATRELQITQLHPDFDDLDERFNEGLSHINIEEILHQFILSHKHAFLFDGTYKKG